LRKLDVKYISDEFTDYLEEIHNTVEYENWYCGHMHIDRNVDKVQFLYESIQEIKIV